MASQELQVVISAVDKASAEIKNVQESVDKGSASFLKMSSAVAAGQLAFTGLMAVGSAVVSIVKESATAFAEAEAQTVVTTKALENMGLTTEEATAAMEQAGDAAVKMGFDDEAAAAALATLNFHTKDVTEAQEALTVAFDLSRAKGIDLETAANVIGLAMEGNTKVLKTYGIELDENASKTEILGSIQEKVAGTAEAYGNTVAGATEKWDVTVGNLKEELGEKFAPVITELADKIQEWVDSEQFETLKVAAFDFIDIVIEYLPKIIDFVYASIQAWDDFTTWLGNVIYEVNEFSASVSNLVSNIQTTFLSAIESVGNWFNTYIIDPISTAIDYLNSFSSKLSSITSTATSTLGGLTSFLGFSDGGVVPGTGNTDSVPALLTPGEIVINPKKGQGVVGDVNVNFNNVNVRSDNDLNAIISAVKRAWSNDLLKRQIGI